MRDDHFLEIVIATANARTEEDFEQTTVDGFSVESCLRGYLQKDYIAWVNGNRKIWGCGSTRQAAIDDAVQTAKSHATTPN
tara:strand:- start:4132 stop:4374 length:243 start_codon:yes stop_codon:yes gene_type:complete